MQDTPILSSEPQIQDFYEIQKTVDVARRRIDQDIERLEGAIRALKSRRNSLAGISRFPTEILSRIFICCAATCERGEPAQLTMDWVKVTHVSRHWRTVAIGCPRLWTTLVFTQPRWVEEMLKRSKMAPLVIDARVGSKSTEAVQLAMDHISRVRELSIVCPSASSLGKLFSSVPRAAPMLQILVLSTTINYYADPFRDKYSIPTELFSDDSSQLRRLELIHCNLDWTSHLLKGLTHLKIHDTAPGTRPSTSLFLDVLEQLPTLTVLDLKDALPSDGSSTVSHQRNVKLRSLTNLHLSDPGSDCANALRHLSVPSSATLKLSCHIVVSDADLSSILTFVSGLWESAAIVSSAAKPYKCPIRSLRIRGFGSPALGLQAWPTVLSFQALSGNPDPPPFIDLCFQWPSGITLGIWDKIIGGACAVLPLEQLASLDFVSAIRQMPEQMLLRRFGKLAHLRSIRASGLAIHMLLSAMIAEPSTATSTNVSANLSTQKLSHNREEMPPAVFFPSLLHLIIEETNFDSSCNGEYAELEDLKACLMERYERKAEVRKLTLSRCRRLRTEHVDELRELVVNVVWDGLETGFTNF
ncbi:hypothetical protein K443DRAFT_576640 [Laccaria amethystina LaAM-08-1]|uniref:F-box domain-containing protein n=1 Tax=Laccaria amethystina LaAM-08-1 TaxID=1095629 RepID=A0A0C9X7W1_9AGAR|nr:hypothetical protein K443DRAFT_576640 [Laccaria amethystina LaAM-08-1]